MLMMGTAVDKVAVIGGTRLFLCFEEVGFYPLDFGKPLKTFNQRGNKISIMS